MTFSIQFHKAIILLLNSLEKIALSELFNVTIFINN